MKLSSWWRQFRDPESFSLDPVAKGEQKQEKQESLSKQIARRVLLLSLIGIVGVGGTIALSLLLTLERVQKRLDEASYVAVRTFDRFFLEIKSDMLATSASLAESNDINRMLRQMRSRNRSFLDLLLVNSSGKVLAQQSRARRPKLNQIDPEPWLEVTRRTDRVYISPVKFESDEPYVEMVVAVTNEIGISTGTLVAKIDLTELWGATIAIKVGKTGYVYITDESGQVVAYSDRRLIESGSNLQNLVGRTPQSIAQPRIHLYRGANDKTVFASGRQLELVSWFAIVEQPASEALAPFIIPTAILSAALLLVALLVCGIIRFTQSRIISPLLSLRAAVAGIASGELDRKIEDINTADELGVLARGFNTMSEQLKQSFATLEEKVKLRTVELAEATRKAEAANEAKSAFLANMSHELRTPLNAILGFAQLLTRSQSLPDSLQENVRIIARSGEHLLTLINQVLDLSKIEAGRVAVNPKNFDLYLLLDDIEDLLGFKASEKGLQLVCDRHPDTERYFNTDEIKLRQVLINLINNAIKFTTEGGVAVRVRQTAVAVNSSKVELEFEIEDTGAGIAPEELDSLFEAFVQTATGKQAQEGTGLGLPISRKFVELMGGDIVVTSVLGRGTTFKFNIEATLADSADVENKRSKRRAIALAPNQPRYRLLVADDKPINRQLLIKLLAPFGFEVRNASNGREAIEIYLEWQPDLIFMDMRMSAMDGYEATREIKSAAGKKNCAIVAVSASIFEEEKALVLEAGCDDFIRKPFKDGEIFEAIAKHLGAEFIYEEEGTTVVEGEKEVLTAKALAALPSELLTGIEDALLELDLEKIQGAIDSIASRDRVVSRQLEILVKSFNYDKIMHLIEESKSVK